MQTDSIENIFARAWSLLAKNPVIVVPGLVVGIVAGIVQAATLPVVAVSDGSGGVAVGTGWGGGLGVLASAAVSFAVVVLSFLITQTYTTGMAGAAWRSGSATLSDGSAAFREDAGRLLAAVVLVAAIGIVAALLTLGIGWFIVLFFGLYVVPAVVLDNYRAGPALQLSARIALRRLFATAAIIVILFVIGIVVRLLALPFAIVPFVGPIVLAVVSQAVTAYATLVIVGEYLRARNAADVVSGPVL